MKSKTLLLGCFLMTCCSEQASLPPGQPDIQGTIQQVLEGESARDFGVVLIEDETGIGLVKAQVRVRKGLTRILRDGKEVGPEVLRQGTRVRAWVRGGRKKCSQSYL